MTTTPTPAAIEVQFTKTGSRALDRAVIVGYCCGTGQSPLRRTTMLTAKQVLESVAWDFRCSKSDKSRGWDQLIFLCDHSSSMDIKLLAQGIVYADSSCRTTGAVSIALRNCTPWQAAKTIAAMHKEGIRLINQVPAWLNQNGTAYLQA